MAAGSKIEWTEVTWNPVTGCTKISHGCKLCYAERLAKRLQAMGVEKYQQGFEVALHHTTLEQPAKWRKPKRVFVNSMSDLFHKAVPTQFIQSVFQVMNQNPQHQFQVLTKRPSRVCQLNGKVNWSSNIWLGVSIESERWVERLDRLKSTDAQVKFLSLEPLIGPLPNLDLGEIDWVIVGGESGPKARPIDPNWVREIRDNCIGNGVPFFFKQWGGVFKKRTGRILDGRTWDEMPQGAGSSLQSV
jgi:protein gp37